MENSKRNLIDFSPLGIIASSFFDKDKMDIGRKGNITSDDGWEIEINPINPIYSDVPCHIEPLSTDNPDTGTVNTMPIITSFKVFCNYDIDVKNGDYITLKTCDNSGTILSVQKGIAGEPSQYVKRIEFIVGIQKWT